jgi:uncharacterized cupin superfamily protein
MSVPPILVSQTDGPLEPAPINPDWIIEGTPEARYRVLSTSTDRTATTVVWECTAGSFKWLYHSEEVIHVLEGGVTLTDTSGTRRIGAGDVIYFPPGSEAVWVIDSYIRKLAVFRTSLPRPLSISFRLWNRVRQDGVAGLIGALRRRAPGGVVPGLP